MSKRAVGLMLLLLCAGGASGETLRGRVVGVMDGDTVLVLDGRMNERKIRLAGIDAPEIGRGYSRPGQPFGRESKRSLADIVYGREVRAECDSKDRYGRDVCAIWIGRTEVNLEQVRRGMAWVNQKYAKDASYDRAEREARSAKRGLWRDSTPVPPWEHRKEPE